MKSDPYLYPDSNALINKLNIRDENLLQEVEIKLVNLRLDDGLPKGRFDYQHLQHLHKHLFQDLYDWAGQQRTIRMSKGGSQFAFPEYIKTELDKLFTKLKTDQLLKNLDHNSFCHKVAYYFNEVNAAHPFREGNGRTSRIFFDQIANEAGYKLAWYKTNHREYIQASIDGFQGNHEPMIKVFFSVAISHKKLIDHEKIAAINQEKISGKGE